jgi:thiol-disulfide isomerase/thioredoxin
MNSSTPQGHASRGFWTSSRLALTLVVCTLLATLGIAGCGGSSNAPSTNAGNAKTDSAANSGPMLSPIALDAQLETLDGAPFKLSELKGKVLVIDLWATWCGPCRYEVPELVKIQQEYGPRGVEVIGLDIDPENPTEAPERVRAFAKEFSINYKLAYIQRDVTAALMRGGSIPQSIVVGRDGRILEHSTGFHPVNTPKKLRAAIEKGLE